MTSKRDECKRCGIRGHVAGKCNKPGWWKRNEKPAEKAPAIISTPIKGDK